MGIPQIYFLGPWRNSLLLAIRRAITEPADSGGSNMMAKLLGAGLASKDARKRRHEGIGRNTQLGEGYICLLPEAQFGHVDVLGGHYDSIYQYENRVIKM